MVVLLVPFGCLDVDVSRNFHIVEFSASGLLRKLRVEQVLQLLQHRAASRWRAKCRLLLIHDVQMRLELHLVTAKQVREEEVAASFRELCADCMNRSLHVWCAV